MNKKLIRLTEQDLHRIVKESVNRILKEGYSQFSDSDFGGDGDPYGLFGDEELEDNLNGYYTFNNIWVKIMNDDRTNAYIMVASNIDNQKQAFEGEEAQRILDKIRYDAENTYGTVKSAIYNNLYRYVL